MLEYTVHFQKGSRVGTRSLRMVHVMADNGPHAVTLARAEFPDYREQKYRIIRVEYFNPATGRIVWES